MPSNAVVHLLTMLCNLNRVTAWTCTHCTGCVSPVMDTESVTFGGAAFRPTKRRKFTRTRRVSESDASEPGKDHPTPPENNGDVIDPPISDALRLRRNRLRKPGIEFSTTRPQSSEPPPPSTESAISDPQAESMKAISDRFVAHSGQVIDVDKHMFVLHPPETLTVTMQQPLTSQGLPI